jgi:hypothetical protein
VATRRRLPPKVQRQFEALQRWAQRMVETEQALLEPLRQRIRKIADAEVKTEAAMREMIKQWDEAHERLLDAEAKQRGVPRGRGLEWDLLVELRGWDDKTLRQVIRSHRRPGRRKADRATDLEMFAEMARLKRLSLSAAARTVAKKHRGVGWRNLRDRYKAWLKTRP